MSESDELLELLRHAVAKELAGELAAAVSYSGGLDSSVIARLASGVAHVKAYSCVTKGSFDSRNVRSCADEEHLEAAVIEMTPEDVPRYVVRAATVLGSCEPVPVSYTIPVLRVIDESSERTILVGSGADELFGGYSRYGSERLPEEAMTKDLAKMKAELSKLASYAGSRGKTVSAPFVVDAVVDFASRLPLELKVSGPGRKVILRQVAGLLGLPSSARPKKAAQYSSGVLKEMERLAKAEGLDLREWTRRICLAGRERS